MTIKLDQIDLLMEMANISYQEAKKVLCLHRNQLYLFKNTMIIEK
jgi:hypothetical protein